MAEKIAKSDAEWRARSTPEQYHILRQRGTERSFTGACWNEKRPGVYRCAGCGKELFVSGTKFESGTGWPSFTRPVAEGRVEEHVDRSHGMLRAEVTCTRCGGHLGHVFPGGPPTGLQYCLNSAALQFEPEPTEGRRTVAQRSPDGAGSYRETTEDGLLWGGAPSPDRRQKDDRGRSPVGGGSVPRPPTERRPRTVSCRRGLRPPTACV